MKALIDCGTKSVNVEAGRLWDRSLYKLPSIGEQEENLCKRSHQLLGKPVSAERDLRCFQTRSVDPNRTVNCLRVNLLCFIYCSRLFRVNLLCFTYCPRLDLLKIVSKELIIMAH